MAAHAIASCCAYACCALSALCGLLLCLLAETKASSSADGQTDLFPNQKGVRVRTRRHRIATINPNSKHRNAVCK